MMQNRDNTDNSELIDDSVNCLKNCQQAINQLSESCCMPNRSPNMTAALQSLSQLIILTQALNTNATERAQRSLDAIAEMGSQVGFLYASCCTTSREPLYQNVFTNLMRSHNNINLIIGNTH